MKISCRKYISSLIISLLSSVVAQADLVLPPGFSVSLVSDQLPAPTNMEFSPDGRLFVSEKNGVLRVIKNGVLLATPFLTVQTDTRGEHGLIGVAFDPGFFSNSYVYVYYVATTPTIHGRISRFTASGDIALAGSEKIIFELDPRPTSIFHVAGSLHFGPDGKLYTGSGDNAGVPFTDNAQRLVNSFGKILRINSDGTIPTDNPFYSTGTGTGQAIWAYGLRNPFTLAFQPGTGRLFANDVGQSTWEEINDIIPGSNYGWPAAEGMSSNPLFKNPIFTYTHGAQTDDNLGCSITGGAFYNPIIPQFPTEYSGLYFFTDYCNNWIHTLDPNTGKVASFGKNVTSNPVGLILGPDGALYFTSEWNNAVYKLAFTGSKSPEIITQPVDQTISVGHPATFTVSASGVAPISYQWQKNNVDVPGATQASYTLAAPLLSDEGSQFKCVVSNSLGNTLTGFATLHVVNQDPPTVSIDYPVGGTTFNSGDTIYFGGTATDPSDPLPPEAYTWEIHFQHDSHFHPFMPPTSGIRSGMFQIPTQGESSSNVWFRIFLTVKDSKGLSTTVIREIFPNQSVFYLKTNPPGLKVSLDGQPVQTPAYVTGVVGFTRTLGVITPQTLNGVNYQFGSWSDGLSQDHSFRTSMNTKTYTADFQAVGSTATGTLTATPNPALVCDGSNQGTTTLEWNSTGTTAVELHVNSPTGNVVAVGGPGAGSFTTQKWIGDGTTFYLQNISAGLPLTPENTLATVTVNLTSNGCLSTF